ncbi:MAG: zinc-dependent alcohol dehydrogenase [Hyphomicrobium sp.]
MSVKAQHGAGRARGQIVVARALWYVKPGVQELRTERLGLPPPGHIGVETLYSAISRGTERLVAMGRVPAGEWTAMRAPCQAGDFPFPVKYGYSAVGTVTAGSDALIGRRVFALHPHQSHFHIPEAMAVVVPDAIPSPRATLAANMETALNAHWDGATAPGERVLVIGAGIVGLLTAHLAQRLAGTRVIITDSNSDRREIAARLGLTFATPDALTDDHDIVFHTSASPAGLRSAIAASAFEGRIIEMSWYGETPVTLDLGGAFHSRRLTILSSQVGHVARPQRGRVSHRERLERALALLDDARLDELVRAEIPFDSAPNELAVIFESPALPPLLRYGGA